eukprot:COSAG04_NODE_28620_length_274_cov_0.908571_1_plen_33_part_01
MPEDEAKLRSVIRAGGEERFNDRTLSAACRHWC